MKGEVKLPRWAVLNFLQYDEGQVVPWQHLQTSKKIMYHIALGQWGERRRLGEAEFGAEMGDVARRGNHRELYLAERGLWFQQVTVGTRTRPTHHRNGSAPASPLSASGYSVSFIARDRLGRGQL